MYTIPVNLCRGVLIIIAGVILFYIMIEYFNKTKNNDDQEQFGEEEMIEDIDYDLNDSKYASVESPTVPVNRKNKENVEANVEANVENDNNFKPVNFNKNKLPNDCFPKDKLTADDLLPKDAANNKWAQVNPAGQGELKNKNFLTAGYHVGVNTIGSTLRNSNMQLRSEPPNPQSKVSPWNQTTINPDLNRRPLEINGCE